ncbi:MAG TPA: hypothetical protein VFC58_00395 [Desulfosporosinus sp.]|nr:hypothetical protein [Desulfosporosinus sp.]
MSTLTLTLKIELVKFIREKFLGKSLYCIDVLSVIEGTVDFGVVQNVDFADDRISIWGAESRVFWLNVNDIINVNFNPNEADVCLLIEAKNNVEVRFMVE